MKKIYLLAALSILIVLAVSSFKNGDDKGVYASSYTSGLDALQQEELNLIRVIQTSDISTPEGVAAVQKQINLVREQLKGMDFWLRYLEPTVYKKLNGPLPVEWETEVFEKFEKPYKREGAGLTLAALYLEEDNVIKDSLVQLIQSSVSAFETYTADSITSTLDSYHHFYLCNRLYLLNLAAIYTTGFECPDVNRIIPELRIMLQAVEGHYRTYNKSFPATAVGEDYLSLYQKTIEFANSQPGDFTLFDHFTFIREYINPLFILNQQAIKKFKVRSKSFVDYSLNKVATSIFDKVLYDGQNAKGIFLRVYDENVLTEIEKVGKLLFYDPVLSGNNKRSCVSCHDPTEYFTDTTVTASLQFNRIDRLARNSPSLINAVYNHLAMLDGKHISLQDQVKDVISKPDELGSSEAEVLKKILSCPDYKKALDKLLEQTPWEEEITLEHISSAITFYYSKFSKFYAPFDQVMNNRNVSVSAGIKEGFNLFMSKAQCATCHFVPQFNGVKPPYIGSEFEVLGVPADTGFKQLSADKGRYGINPAFETLHAFRTGSLRNAEHTAPYMHNGVFRTMDEVINFYDAGGGAGKGLMVNNQTLSSDSLRLTKIEKDKLVSFIKSLNEEIIFETPPASLPLSKDKRLNGRRTGGEY
jgi:cytochrome c peroxidase